MHFILDRLSIRYFFIAAVDFVLNKYDPTSVIVIEQGEEGKAIAMFKDPEVKPLIESAGHIYDSTVISSYF